MWSPYTAYEVARQQRRDLEAELEQRRQQWQVQTNPKNLPKLHRYTLGLGSIAVGLLLIINLVV